MHEIRCQFIILIEFRCRFIILTRKDEPTSEIRYQFIILIVKSGVGSSFSLKSGVSSSFLPEKMN